MLDFLAKWPSRQLSSSNTAKTSHACFLLLNFGFEVLCCGFELSESLLWISVWRLECLKFKHIVITLTPFALRPVNIWVHRGIRWWLSTSTVSGGPCARLCGSWTPPRAVKHVVSAHSFAKAIIECLSAAVNFRLLSSTVRASRVRVSSGGYSLSSAGTIPPILYLVRAYSPISDGGLPVALCAVFKLGHNCRNPTCGRCS